jgi:putative methionine-R-sulfoxide reductase with GAF domain
MTPAHNDLLQEFQDFAKSAPTSHSLMELMAKRLHQKMTRYNWTGFYLVDPADSNYLIVAPLPAALHPTLVFPSTPASAAPPPPAK